MYAPGVAETMLEDAFASSTAAPPPQGGANPGTRGAGSQLLLSPHQAALIAQFARSRRGGGAGSGGSSPGGYEGRTDQGGPGLGGFGGRGGAGNYAGAGQGGIWSWLTGRTVGGGAEARAEEGHAQGPPGVPPRPAAA